MLDPNKDVYGYGDGTQMTNINLESIIEKVQTGTIDQVEQLELCRRRISNFRQTVALSEIISFCENEPLAAKLNKVSLNIYSMLHFASLPDDVVSEYMSKNLKDLYYDVFDYFHVSKEEVDLIMESRGSSLPTTVEVNNFIHAVISQNIDRINNLPSSVRLKNDMVARGLMREETPLYSSADIRERAILYFADLPSIEKMRVISSIPMKYGFLLTRLNDKQYAKKLEKLLGAIR